MSEIFSFEKRKFKLGNDDANLSLVANFWSDSNSLTFETNSAQRQVVRGCQVVAHRRWTTDSA